MMLKVLFYSYYLGIHSCRKIWESLRYRADFIFLSAKQVPDFRTINLFRKRHAKELPGLFSQIVHLCVSLDMVDFKELAIDGQKIKANANFRKSKNLDLLEKSHNKIKKKISRILEEEVEDKDSPDNKIEERLSKLKRKENALLELKDAFKEINKDEFINMTDKDAKVMKHKDKRSLPSYNHQAAVDGKYGVTCAVKTSDKIDRPSDLQVLINSSEENTGQSHETVTADSAFCDFNVLENASKNQRQNILVKDRLMNSSESKENDDKLYNKERFYFDESGDLICPEGNRMARGKVYKHGNRNKIKYEGTKCKHCQKKHLCTKGKKRSVIFDTGEKYKYEMRKKLKQKENKELYYRRGAIVEPSFGNDQHNYKWTQHHLRGLMKAGIEFILIRIGSNLRKICKYRGKECLGLT